MSCDMPKRQSGGCGESYFQSGGNMKKKQCGGGYKEFPEKAIRAAAAWRAEVKAVRASDPSMTYKDAMVQASANRKSDDPGYQTTKQKIDEKRKVEGYGKKNKRPLSLSAAEGILRQYYRDRSSTYKAGPLRAMRKDISSCHKNPKKTLTACAVGTDGKLIVTEDCKNSWKYRPGNTMKSPTGPGIYDIDGLDNLCGEKGKAAKKASALYNAKFMRHKAAPPKKEGIKRKGNPNFRQITDPVTGRIKYVKASGPQHQEVGDLY
jgi:hypothetical protein